MTPLRATRQRSLADRALDRLRDAAPVRGTRRPRRGAKRTLLGTIRQLPAYLRLLGGLLLDRRVAALDKALVAGAIAYILLPTDLIPDVIPFLGEVDDVFLLVTALQRLIENAGRRVLIRHWTGDPAELADLNLQRVLAAAAFFLPLSMQRRLRRMGTSAEN